MAATRILTSVIFLLLIQLSFAQKQPVKPVKATTQKELKKEAVIKNEADLKKFEDEWIHDSIQAEEEWRKQWVIDSIRLVKEAQEARENINRIYKEKWNPRDSLKYVDDKTENLFKERADISLSEVIKLINAEFTGPLQKARAIYYWIAKNIHYDWGGLAKGQVKYNQNIEADAQQAFGTRKGVCEHFSSLYQYMALQCGLEAVKITGYSKVLPYLVVNKNRTDHAWNAVKINNRWKLLDVTWASEKDSTVEYFWFDTPPEKFIYSHLPTDTNYQLVKKKLSLDEFAQLPLISQYLFYSKAAIKIPSLGFFANTSGLFEIEIKNKSRNYNLDFFITSCSEKNRDRFSGNESWQKISSTVAQDRLKESAIYKIKLPAKGTWWLKVDVIEKLDNKYIDKIEYPSCMIFQMTFL